MESQCEQLNKQLRLENNLDQDRSRDIAKLRKKHEAGRQNTTTAVMNFCATRVKYTVLRILQANELSDELEANFKNATDKTGAENKRILSSLSARLKQDDKTLATLETLMTGMKSHGNDASTAKKTTQLSAMLAVYVAEEIHDRLDRLYLESIQRDESGPEQAASGGDETIAALEEELESLYPEIEILADMSTRQQFNEPILREIQNEHGQLRAVSQRKLNQVCISAAFLLTDTDDSLQVLDILIEMTLSKQALTRWLKDRESSCELLEQLATFYQEEAGNQLASQPPSRRESLRRRSLQTGTFLSNAQNPTVALEQPALESLLRRIGVSPESVLRPRVEDGGACALHEKRIHMSDTSRSLGAVVDLPVAAHLAPADMASQLLTSSVHANSRFNTSLPDPGQEEALLGLEADLGSLQKGVQRLNLDALHQRDKAQDKFMERWA